jgi:hypothetical protein
MSLRFNIYVINRLVNGIKSDFEIQVSYLAFYESTICEIADAAFLVHVLFLLKGS